jgi:hypothetical protein
VNNREKFPKEYHIRILTFESSGVLREKVSGTRHPKSRNSERGSDPSVCKRTRVVKWSIFGDLGIGTHGVELPDFASGEVSKGSELSIGKRTRVTRSPYQGFIHRRSERKVFQLHR